MMLALLVLFAIEVTAILGLALLLVALLPRASAATRHCVLATAVAASFLVPPLTQALPRLQRSVAAFVPADGPTDTSTVASVAVSTYRLAPAAAPAAVTPTADTPRWNAAAAIAPLVWLAGLSAMALVVAAGLLRLRATARRASPIADGRWHRHLQRIAAGDPRLARVALLQGRQPSLLVTWGFRRPRIVIPAHALSWDDERIAIVLEHEVEHIRRGDWLVQLGTQLLCACAWFTPLTWIVAARLRLESERACDDAVLRNGVDAAAYAEHLVDMARLLAQPREAWIAAPAMARASSLERRVTAMLDNTLVRRPTSRFVRRAIVAAGLAATAAIATVAAQSAFATVTGTVRDQLGGTLPDVTLALTHTTTGAKHEIKSDASGHFELVGLVPGNYDLELWRVGFKNLHEQLQLAGGQTLNRSFDMPVGTLQETIRVIDGPPAPSTAPRRPVSPSSNPGAFTAEPNSGRIVPPRKIKDVRVVYPQELRGTGTAGQVVAQAIIGTDGAVREVRTLSATNSAFDDAAREAVRQWRFTTTLLNCMPIEVEMTVTTSFGADDNGREQMNRRELGDAALPAPPPPGGRP